MPAKSLLLVLCAIFREREVLLLQRRNPPYRGYWGMPGGKMEFAESIAEAACREALEETGLSLAYEGLCGTATEVILDEQGAPDAHFSIHVARFSCTDHAQPVCHGEEGRLQWFAQPDLVAQQVIPSDRLMLDAFCLQHAGASGMHFIVRRQGEEFMLETVLPDCPT